MQVQSLSWKNYPTKANSSYFNDCGTEDHQRQLKDDDVDEINK